MTVRPLLVALLALALPATACSTGGPATSAFGRDATASPAAPAKPRGVVTVAEAKAILAEWDKADRQLAVEGTTDQAAVLAGLAEEVGTAQSKLDKMLGEKAGPSKPIARTRFAIPAKVAGEPWFMAEFSRKGGSGWWQAIFQKTPAGWRAVAMSATTAKARPPAAARDRNGLATVVSPDDGGGLIASPRQIARSHARMQNTFGQDRRARRTFTADALTRRSAAAARRLRESMRGPWTVVIRAQAAPEIYALRTANGGAIAWYGIRQQMTMTVRPGIGAGTTVQLTDRGRAALSHGNRFSRRVVIKDAAIYLAVVPSSPGLVRVPAEWAIPLSVTGS